jgi:regulator of replication initiation timing
MIPSKKEIEEYKSKFEQIYQATVGQHPDVKRLEARVDELLASNTALVLENRELKKELADWRS